MKLKGKTFCFEDNVNTDEIIPARYLSTSDPVQLAEFCMEDSRPGFGKRDDLKGAIICAGENFGCGSSREHAPISIKYAGISCVIAKSFARIFLRNSINIGLPVVELKESDQLKEGDLIEVDLENGRVINLSRRLEFEVNDYPPFLQDIIKAGGWMNYARKVKGEK